MSKVLRFDDFIKNEASEVRQQVFRQVESAVWPGLFRGSYLTEAEKNWLRTYMTGKNAANVSESVMSILRDGIEKMKSTEVGQAVAQKLGNLLDNGVKFANYLADLIQRAWDKILAYFIKKYDSTKALVTKELKSGKLRGIVIKENIQKDVKDLSDTAKFWLTTIPGKIVSTIKEFYTKDVVREALENSSDIISIISTFDPNNISEGLFGFLDSISQKISKFPPFNILTKIKDLSAEKTNQFLMKFSEITKLAGGPGVFEFAAISAIAGFFIEYYVKHIALEGVDDILSSEAILRVVPMSRQIISAIEIVALIVAIIETTKEAGELDIALKK